jgi:type II secretory pathway component PulF
VTLRHRIRFYQQLAVLVRAGVSIRTSLTRLKERMKDKEVRILSQKIDAGERIGDAFTAAGFSPFECHLIAAGERSAHLDSMFEHLAEFWTRELELRHALIRPLYYPIVVLHLALAISALVEFMASAPVPVVVVHFVMRLAFLYAFIFVVYTLVKVSWSSPLMRRFWLFLPIIGSSMKAAYAYRWITALRIEFTAGVSLYRAVGDAWRASGYVECDRFAAEGETAMQGGAELSKLVKGWKQLPRDWVDFIETGEISGKFEEAFTKLESEAAYAWKLARERMAEWVPKISYFVVLIMVAVVVGRMVYQAEVAPIVDVEKQIDDASK